jgi:hypothetical protein
VDAPLSHDGSGVHRWRSPHRFELLAAPRDARWPGRNGKPRRFRRCPGQCVVWRHRCRRFAGASEYIRVRARSGSSATMEESPASSLGWSSGEPGDAATACKSESRAAFCAMAQERSCRRVRRSSRRSLGEIPIVLTGRPGESETTLAANLVGEQSQRKLACYCAASTPPLFTRLGHMRDQGPEQRCPRRVAVFYGELLSPVLPGMRTQDSYQHERAKTARFFSGRADEANGPPAGGTRPGTAATWQTVEEG